MFSGLHWFKLCISHQRWHSANSVKGHLYIYILFASAFVGNSLVIAYHFGLVAWLVIAGAHVFFSFYTTQQWVLHSSWLLCCLLHPPKSPTLRVSHLVIRSWSVVSGTHAHFQIGFDRIMGIAFQWLFGIVLTRHSQLKSSVKKKFPFTGV